MDRTMGLIELVVLLAGACGGNDGSSETADSSPQATEAAAERVR